MSKRRSFFIHTVKLILFADLGAIMFISKILLEWAPNIHLLGVLTMAYTLAFRFEALIPIYVYVFLNGLYAGFNMWWIPYLYLWAVLWGVTMLLPKKMPPKIGGVVYMIVCCLHGLLFGTLYAPAQAIMYGFNFKQTLAWIVAGLPWDCVHGIGNLVLGTLILPISDFLKKVNTKYFAPKSSKT